MTDFIKNVLFPTDISYGSTGGPKFKTLIFSPDSGYENAIDDWNDVKCEYNISEALKTGEQMDELRSFFLTVGVGKGYGFRYKDWQDFQINAQTIAFGDGSTTIFQVFKTYTLTDPGSGQTTTYNRTISKLAWGTVAGVTVNGTAMAVGTDYWVSYASGKITFTVAPANYAVVTIGYAEFHVPVRFDTDEMDATYEYNDTLSWPNVNLVEVRDWYVAINGPRALNDYLADNPPTTGGSSGSNTGAVTFDGVSAGLFCDSLIADDGYSFSLSFWFRYPNGLADNLERLIYVSNAGNIAALANCTVALNGALTSEQIPFAMEGYDSLGEEMLGLSTLNVGYDGSWHHVLAVIQGTSDYVSVPGQVCVFIDGVSASSDLLVPSSNAGPFPFSGVDFSVGFNGTLLAGENNVNGYLGDMYNFWFAPNQSLITGSTISPDMIAKFRDPSTGLPVDLGADGSIPTGTPPAVFFSGDATSFGTNRGTGGTFTATGLTTAASDPTT